MCIFSRESCARLHFWQIFLILENKYLSILLLNRISQLALERVCRAAQRNLGPRANLIRGPYFFPKNAPIFPKNVGERRKEEVNKFSRTYPKKGSKFFSGQTPVKLRFKKFFRTNTCKITSKTHLFATKRVKLRSKRFLSYHDLYKKRTK